MEKYTEALIKAIESLGQPNWLDYLQVIASIVSIVISAWAVVMAVRIPKKIAHKQDGIALFNKRFDSFSSFQKCQAFANLLKSLDNIDGYRVCALHFFADRKDLAFDTENVRFNLVQTSIMLQQLAFLYDDVDYNDVGIVFASMKDFVFSLEKADDVETLKTRFINAIDIFTEKYEKIFFDTLKIS